MSKRQFFSNNINNLEELKKEYKKLSFIYHPDMKTGNKEKFQNMLNEYEILFQYYKLHSTNKQEQKEDVKDYTNKINELIDLLKNLNFNEIEVEICGTWLYVRGSFDNTFPIKDKLFALGFRYQKSKKQFYNPMDENFVKTKGYRGKSQDKIRQIYGSSIEKIEGKKNKPLK